MSTNIGWIAAALAVTACVGFILYRWLQPRLSGIYKVAVPVYIAVIMVMVSFAIGASAGDMPLTVAAGAVIFAISDFFVARDRFVQQSFENKLLAIPLYYIAQLLLAVSVAATQS